MPNTLTDFELLRRLQVLRDNCRRDLNLTAARNGSNSYATQADVDKWIPQMYPHYKELKSEAVLRGLETE